jgi:hypothetical protein
METEPIPAIWDAISCPDFSYWWGMDVLEHHWERTKPFAEKSPESDEFQEFMFWRRISVIWACSTIEVFVNSEGTSWLGEGFYKDNLERLGVVQKIHTLYALKYQVRLPRKLGRLTFVSKLFELRNTLVHPKTHEVTNEEIGKHKCTPLDELMKMEFRHLRRVFWTVTGLFEPTGVGETDDEASEQTQPFTK